MTNLCEHSSVSTPTSTHHSLIPEPEYIIVDTVFSSPLPLPQRKLGMKQVVVDVVVTVAFAALTALFLALFLTLMVLK